MQHQRSHEIFRDLKKAFKRSFDGGSECAFHAANYGMLKDRLVDTSEEQEVEVEENAVLPLNDQRVLFAVDELLEVLAVPMRVALDWAADKCDEPSLMLFLRNVHGNNLWIQFTMFPPIDDHSYDGVIYFTIYNPAPLASGVSDKRGADMTERYGEWRKPVKAKPKTKVKPKKPRKVVAKDAEND